MSDCVDVVLDLLDPASQIVAVQLRWTPRVQRQGWALPLWTPGSYTVRDHAQYLHSLSLEQCDQQLPLKRTGTSSWQVDLDQLAPLTLRYCIEARQLTVRTCYLDPEFASLCLAAAIVELGEHRWSAHRLTLRIPEGWSSHVPLPGGDTYLAEDFDQLVDAPVHAGRFSGQPFAVDGCKHELLLVGEPPGGWPDTLLTDISEVCAATCRLMQSAPPCGNRYQLVIQMLDQGYGGLEHDHGAVLQYSWGAMTGADGYRQLLQLVGHEYLHQWNVRRLRPFEYRPYDYSQPVISDGLWFAEGITSYYDFALPLLAGLSDRSSLLKDLSKDFSRLLCTPGRMVQSLAQSSREAWIKLYKSNPTSADTQISYYRLGAAVAFCLDVGLRQSQSSLANVLRRLWNRHGPSGRGYTRADVEEMIALDNQQLSRQLAGWLDEPGNLPLIASIEALGLNLDPLPSTTAETGLTLTDLDGAVQITRVARNSPAHQAGLVVGDEVIAAAGIRVRQATQLASLIPRDQPVPFTYARRGKLAEVQITGASPGIERWVLSWNSGASVESRALREQWFQIL
ncbi:MAG: M61 family metallopeptidase [Prochlorococcus sp.]